MYCVCLFSNFDGYTNSIYTITVAAIDRKNLHPTYSEECSANLISMYSSGSGHSIVSIYSSSFDGNHSFKIC
jgi:kexin